MKLKYILGILVLLLLTVGTASAQSFILNTANEDYFKGKIQIQVDYDETTGTIAVQYVSDGVPEDPIGIDTFYYNLDRTTYGITNVMEGSADATSSWHKNFDGLTADGFGDFSSHRSLNSAGTGGISDPIIFTLMGSSFPTVIPLNDNEHRVAVHIRFSDGKSTWVTDGNGGTEIPEFPSIALPVAAILGITFIIGSRKKE